MITEIIEPQSATYVLHLPQEYVNKRVEISIALATDKSLAPEPPRRPREVPSYLHGKILCDIISPIIPAEDWDCVREGDDEQYHFNNAYP